MPDAYFLYGEADILSLRLINEPTRPKVIAYSVFCLLTALALWIEPGLFLQLLIVMALAGGVLTIVLGAWHVMRRQRDKLAVPYGVAISTGGLWVLATHYLPASGIAGVSG